MHDVLASSFRLCCFPVEMRLLLLLTGRAMANARLQFRRRSCGIDAADPDQGKYRIHRPCLFDGVALAHFIYRGSMLAPER